MTRLGFTTRIAALVLVGLSTYLGFGYALENLLSREGGPQDAPRIEIAETVWDFGAVSQAAKLEAAFVVKNTGGRRLLLVEQSASCDCLSAARPAVSIPPGGQTRLRVSFDASRFWGAVREQTRFRTNDPRQRSLTLVLAADVTPPEQ